MSIMGAQAMGRIDDAIADLTRQGVTPDEVISLLIIKVAVLRTEHGIKAPRWVQFKDMDGKRIAFEAPQ